MATTTVITELRKPEETPSVSIKASEPEKKEEVAEPAKKVEVAETAKKVDSVEPEKKEEETTTKAKIRRAIDEEGGTTTAKVCIMQLIQSS